MHFRMNRVFTSSSRDRPRHLLADAQTIPDTSTHNRLVYLTISSALGLVGDPSQLLGLKTEVEGMLRLLSEAPHSILTNRISSTNGSWY